MHRLLRCFTIIFIYIRVRAADTEHHPNLIGQKCSSSSNIVIFSATGRVGTTNMLSMLAHHSNIVNIGEIFMSTGFKSANLPPNNQSPLTSPAPVAMQNRLVSRIIDALKPQDRTARRLASVKFWHAWTNGVTVRWLAQQLISHGCVSHFLLIARNPVRITISEMYGHKYHSWSYRGDKTKSVQATACARSRLAYHIGARWAGEMAVAHYLDFQELLTLSSSHDISALGLMYEVDILPSAHKAFSRVSEFLGVPHGPQAARPPAAKKGMLCPLSSMLVNYEELTCSLRRWELTHGIIREGNSSRPDSDELGLSWMGSDWDDQMRPSFPLVMAAWKRLAESARPIAECTLRDLLDPSNEDPLPRMYQVRSSSRQDGLALCGEGGATAICKEVSAVPADKESFCLLAMHRTGCDSMTFRAGRCFLHKNTSDFRLVSCGRSDVFRHVLP